MTTAGNAVSRLVLAVAVTVLLGANAAIIVDRQGDGDGQGTASGHPGPASPASPATPGKPSALELVLPELIAFVEEARGLRFKTPPKVELLSDADFEAKLQEGGEDDQEADEFDPDAYVGLLRALGLLEGDVDLDTVMEGQIEGVLGFYDEDTKTLYGRGVEPTPYVKEVLVHELTHALDDQHFGLTRPDLDDEADAAFVALVEGSAMVVERAWFDSRSAGEQLAIQEAEADAEPEGYDDIPEVFTRLLEFPYRVGPVFVDTLVGNGGQARVNQAFARPPTTTEQVLHPDRFLAGDGARPVPEPRADGPVVDEGTIGEVGLILMLESAVSSSVARRAAAGWGGDHYVAWSNRAQTCVRFNMVMDSARDTSELLSALRGWASQNPGAYVSGSETVTVTNCA